MELKAKINYSTEHLLHVLNRIACYCRAHEECHGCYFHRKKINDCALAAFADGDKPCDWVNE